MSNYPEIEIDKKTGYVKAHHGDGSYTSVNSVEAIIFAKMLFELEKIAMSLENLDERARKSHPM